MMTDEEKAIHKKLKSRWWRLNNLYWVEDEKGRKVKFRLKWAQRLFLQAMWWLNVILKARQLGMSTLIAIYILDTCLFEKNKTCGIIDKTDKDATKKLAKIRFAYENLDCPDACDGVSTAVLGAMLKRDVRLVADNDHELEFSNDSKVWAGTSLRGGTLQFLHVSELGYIAAYFPKKAEEIRSGALNTVHEGAIVVIESTHEGGKYGLNYEMIAMSQESPADLGPMDWKFHFFAWWQDPKYCLPNPRPVVDPKLIEYFSDLQVKHGILLSDGQKAWYEAKKRTQKEAMAKEFPSTPEEAVNSVIRGAIYGEEISRARVEGRIQDFNLEPGLPWYVSWDLGMSDFTDMWAIQPVGTQHRILNFYENNGFGIDHYVGVLREWERLYGPSTFNFLPHDAARRQIGTVGGVTTVQTMTEMNVKNVVVVPVTPDIWTGINRLRAMMPNMVFHKSNLSQDRMKDGQRHPSGLGALEAYRTQTESSAGAIREMPLHDAASHAADGLRTYAEAEAAGMVARLAFKGRAARERMRDDDDDWPSERQKPRGIMGVGMSAERMRRIRVQ